MDGYVRNRGKYKLSVSVECSGRRVTHAVKASCKLVLVTGSSTAFEAFCSCRYLHK